MDDFYINPDDFDNDAELSLIDEEKLKVLDKIEEYVKLTRDSVKFQEKDEFDTNFRVLSRYISAMCDLSRLEDGEIESTDESGNECTEKLTDEEILEKIKQIEMSISDVTHQMLSSVEMDDKDNEKLSLEDLVNIKDKSEDDGSLDF